MWQWSTHEVRGQLTGTGSLLHLVGSRNQTQFLRFGSRHPELLSHLTNLVLVVVVVVVHAFGFCFCFYFEAHFSLCYSGDSWAKLVLLPQPT